MKLLRAMAIALALSLMLGEAFRTWGADRPAYAWLDDQIMGALLLIGAWLVRLTTAARMAFFAGAWGANAGMLYGSFFGKVFEPARSNPGNFDLGLLTALIGVAFATSIVGLAWTIHMAGRRP
jgi:hypothetical protein